MKEKYHFAFLIVLLILIILMPFGVQYLFPIPDTVYIQTNSTICFGCDDVYDPTILILMAVIIPILVMISIIIRYFPKKNYKTRYWIEFKIA